MTTHRLAIAAALILACLFPLFAASIGQTALVGLATRILIYAIAAASLNIVMGFGGMVSFGHAAFFGVGGYAVGVLAAHHGADPIFGLLPGSNAFLVAVPVAMLCAAVVAAIIGALSLRTGGAQFIMITLAFAQILFFLAVSIKAYGGDEGLVIRRPNVLFGLNLRDRATMYFVTLAITAGFLALVWRLKASTFGAVLNGVRQNERRMAALGYDTYGVRLYAFILSGAGTGLAGALMANALRFASPDMLHWTKSGDFIIMVVLGGLGTLAGPLLGAAAFLTLETYLGAWTQYWQLPLGIILLLVVLGTRGGLMRLLTLSGDWIRRRLP